MPKEVTVVVTFRRFVTKSVTVHRAESDWSAVLDDLRVPPGNQLEALKGTRKGQHSIRINDRWRVCFVWSVDGAKSVEIVDYR